MSQEGTPFANEAFFMVVREETAAWVGREIRLAQANARARPGKLGTGYLCNVALRPTGLVGGRSSRRRRRRQPNAHTVCQGVIEQATSCVRECALLKLAVLAHAAVVVGYPQGNYASRSVAPRSWYKK